MMAKKDFGAKLSQTRESQDKALEERFEKADSLLLAPVAPSTAALPPKPTPVPVAKDSTLVIRDTFSLPHDDYALIDELRQTAARQGVIATKSEMVRAGLRLLRSMEALDVSKAVLQLERLKPGRKS